MGDRSSSASVLRRIAMLLMLLQLDCAAALQLDCAAIRRHQYRIATQGIAAESTAIPYSHN